MPAVQYPFIDIAVHPRVRERFSRGEGMVLFSADLGRALWANGAGAELFGHAAVYDLLDQGVSATDITFRQLEATARQLADTGESRNFMIRIARGFQRVMVQATVELVRLSSGERAVLVSLPVSMEKLSIKASAEQMLQGLDDPDTHMAVIGADGEIIAASPGYAALGVTQQTAKAMIVLAGDHADRLVKRPVATGKGYLPAAVGRLSDEPPLNLLFAVETVLGHLDPIEPPAPALSTAAINHNEPSAAPSFIEAIDAVADIEELDDAPEDDADDAGIVSEEEAALVAEEAALAESPVDDTMADFDEPAAEQSEPEIARDDATAEIDVIEAEEEPAGPEDTQDEFEDLSVGEAEELAALQAEADGQGASEVEHKEDAYDDAAVEPALAEAEPEETTASADDGSEGPATDHPAPFVFRPNSRATRFVWKIDAEGRFSEVSGEFAEAVGPHASNIIGVGFGDIAALFNLDPDGKIAEALARRDTWSGKTIHWPIEGTSLAVPVDLAALPTYTRSREFDGFRGFGVVRLSDAAEDPLALGLSLGPDGVVHDSTELGQPADVLEELAETEAAEEVAVETAPEAAEAPASEGIEPAVAEDDTGAQTPDVSDEQPESKDAAETSAPPKHEPPALRIVETPSRRLTDKIVQLHGAGPTLSNAEQANFREIAKRLEAFGVRDAEEEAETAAAQETDEAPATEKNSAVEKNIADHAETPDEDIAEDGVESVEAGDDQAPLPQADSDDDVTEGLEETVSQMDMLANFIPPRVKMTDGLSTELIDQMPVAVLIHAGDQLIHANPEFMRLTGYQSLQDLADVGGIDALLQRHDLEEKAGRAGAMMLVTVDDDLVPVTAKLQSIRWQESSALMLALIPVANEVSVPARPAATIDTRPADRMIEKVAKLQVEVEELRSILETATDGVVVIGLDGDIRSMNRSASALFNYDEEETRGKPFVMLFAHESQKAVLDYLNGLSGHGVASVLNDGREVIGREAAGGFVPLFMTMGQLTSSSGYCAVIRDITQWKRTEDELRSAKSAAETANDHKTDFLARVSHEIRTPLNAIIGFSDMMASERFGPIGHPRYIEYANDIGRSGRHVLDIVNDLLDISKIEAGEMELDFVAIGLNEAVSEAVALLQPQANSQRVIIRTALSQAVPEVVADLRSIKQIALNILSNSIRFTPSGGQIVVSTSYEANGSVVLRVRDTGIGMTRGELDQAMKPFRQVSTQTRNRGDGTGLGLPLTKAMVDANRATFAISSTPNEGTLVEITFPSQRVLAG
ncbi:PAS domain-containing sensor histidine kinase [Rhizobium sp. S152]|uniref:sensor histidine kinase n=1 Tax=Rhizobium sp. S152 TaxID=3055038 RepID=UPI0025AA0A30|nr:PAS domain-containing sensor histidine kinase [Rhizobium sp. S152]MDM9626454.1 PAS domain-containing sensor histidine kinase [Rhizobium sp. S152]